MLLSWEWDIRMSIVAKKKKFTNMAFTVSNSGKMEALFLGIHCGGNKNAFFFPLESMQLSKRETLLLPWLQIYKKDILLLDQRMQLTI